MEFAQRRRVEARTTDAVGFRPPATLGLSRANQRKARHSGLFQAVHRLDVQLDRAAREELARWVRDEYQNEFGDVPLGFVAVCHLGPPYVDHRLDLIGSIVEHYAPADVMPDPFASARMLARTGAYEFIEVYASGELRPVLPDGSVVA
jgi:hypothetical protein